jgi:hypothetical protein
VLLFALQDNTRFQKYSFLEQIYLTSEKFYCRQEDCRSNNAKNLIFSAERKQPC